MKTALGWAFALYAVLTLSSMAGMSIGAGILFIVLLAHRLPVRQEFKHFNTQKYAILSLILVLACALSLICAKLNPLEIAGQTAPIHLLRELSKLWYFAWPLLLVAGLRKLSPDERERVLATWICAFAAISALGIVQYYTGFPRPQTIPGNEGHFHTTLFFGHHLSTASILIFPYFATLDFLLKKERFILPKWFLGLALLMGSATLFFTFSRTLWVALPLGILIWILWSLPKRAALVALVLAAVAIGGAATLPRIQHRITDQGGTGERRELWAANLHFFELKPWTGVGLRHNQDYSGIYLESLHPGVAVFSGHAHNNFLEFLAGTGAIGIAAWAMWCLGVFWILFRVLRKQPVHSFAKGLICAWIVFQLNGLTQVNFWEGKVMHQMMWTLGWTLLW